MSKLRERFEEELRLRGYSEVTNRIYVRAVRKFVEFHDRSPRRLGAEEIRAYLVHITIDKQWSRSGIHQAICALKFFYTQVLDRPWEISKVHYPRRKKKLPVFLTQQEVVRLLSATSNLKHKGLLMTLYSAGLRLSEVLALEPTDIDSSTMRIHVREGKGGKERYSVLSATLLETLRCYFRRYRPQPWLFCGATQSEPMSPRTVQRIVGTTAQQAGLLKQVTPHVLRHSFATHLLEQGTSLVYIQALLGHRNLKSTVIYTHVNQEALSKVPSPLDSLSLPPPEPHP
jgi:site-specific recombinase XerD